MRQSWKKIVNSNSAYEQFEHAIMLLLTAAIVVLVALAALHLLVAVAELVWSDRMNPANPAVFQGVFGMFFTVVIGLEFKHSLVVTSSQESVVRARSIILIGMLATVRKFIVIDLGAVHAVELLAIAGAILALGVVYWLVRDQDRRILALRLPGAIEHH